MRRSGRKQQPREREHFPERKDWWPTKKWRAQGRLLSRWPQPVSPTTNPSLRNEGKDSSSDAENMPNFTTERASLPEGNHRVCKRNYKWLWAKNKSKIKMLMGNIIQVFTIDGTIAVSMLFCNVFIVLFFSKAIIIATVNIYRYLPCSRHN